MSEPLFQARLQYSVSFVELFKKNVVVYVDLVSRSRSMQSVFTFNLLSLKQRSF